MSSTICLSCRLWSFLCKEKEFLVRGNKPQRVHIKALLWQSSLLDLEYVMFERNILAFILVLLYLSCWMPLSYLFFSWISLSFLAINIVFSSNVFCNTLLYKKKLRPFSRLFPICSFSLLERFVIQPRRSWFKIFFAILPWDNFRENVGVIS